MQDDSFQSVENTVDVCNKYCEVCGEEDNIEIVHSCHVFCHECRSMSNGCGD